MDKINSVQPISAAEGSSISQHELDEILKKLKDLERELANKVDCDTFDNEIAALRDMIGNMDSDKPATSIATTAPVARASGPQLSTKDMNMIREILQKFPGVEDTQNKILK